MDSQKLKSIIKSQGKTYKQCADAIQKSLPSFDRKSSGKQKFPVNEMEELGNFLGMSGQEKAEVFLDKESAEKTVSVTYEYPCADIKNLVVTNDKKSAAHYIENGYELFSVPQMFGDEHGAIVLYTESSHSHNENGMEILKHFEDEARRRTG